MKLIVIIRDPMPVALLDEPCGHRRVEIELTPEQAAKIELRKTGHTNHTDIREQISFCFLEVVHE